MSGKKPWEETMDLDPALHTPARIAVLLFLMPRTTATFSTIQKALDLSSGNLSSHLKKLETSEFILIEKKFVQNKPTTIVSITSRGHISIINYVKMLNQGIKLQD